jgi:hypothetical protein
MAVRYFCDNCGVETGAGDLQALVISIPPASETFDVCPACARRLRGELERCSEAKEARTPVGPAPNSGRALGRYGALLDVPGVGALARVTAYVAVFIAFFVLVTFLR